MPGIYAIGETLLDIIFRNGQPVSATPGGSMLNTAVSLGRLGIPVSFVSDYGNDEVGHMIDKFLTSNQVDISHVRRYENHKSGLALAFLNESSDASYEFYKDFPEKRLEDLKIPFRRGDFLLFGSFFALTTEVRKPLLRVLNDAREAGVIIMYDPNFRKPHLRELDVLRPLIMENIRYADLVRGSDEDFELIFGVSSASQAWKIVEKEGCRGLYYTANRNGVDIISDGISIHLRVPGLSPVSTIGAGDNFNAGILYTLMKKLVTRDELQHLPELTWRRTGENAIAFSSDVCMHYENYISFSFADEMKSRQN
jgi:fructokinase